MSRVIDHIQREKESVSLVVMSLTANHFSHYYDIERIKNECLKYGILFFIDLAHSIGSVPIHLTKWDVDAAYWSTSKYLNSGAGNIGGIYIHPKYRGISPGIKGWFGTDRDLFSAQSPVFAPSPQGLKRFQISGFDHMQLAKVDASLSYFVDVEYSKAVRKTN